jgi:hypothetical protein
MPGKVTAADYKFVEAHVVEHMSEGDKTITNPWSGDAAIVNPLIAALYLMIEELQNGMYEKYGLTTKNWVSKFDRARYLILKLDQEIYMNFVD